MTEKNNFKLTKEQEAIVAHPNGKHARINAVAGAGKTTTMIYRLKKLIEIDNVDPKKILILMFNKKARTEFTDKVNENIEEGKRPAVNNFHSYSYSIILDAIAQGKLANEPISWVEENEEIYDNVLMNVVSDERAKKAKIDSDDLKVAISNWKNILAPPFIEYAGHRGKHEALMVELYKQVEDIRTRENAYTYDDYVVEALRLIKEGLAIDHPNYIIIDEFQDTNYAQEQLIKSITKDTTDIMVVGDVDQTIYEWRGARPKLMLDFHARFNNLKKDTVDYRLSGSMRFGPKIAQAAYNLINNNEIRVQKPIIATNYGKETKILTNYLENSYSQTWMSKQLTTEIAQLIKKGVKPGDIGVLTRMNFKLDNIAIELLAKKIPFKILGSRPFFTFPEIKNMIYFLQLIEILKNGKLSIADKEKISYIIKYPQIEYITEEMISDWLENGADIENFIAVDEVKDSFKKRLEVIQQFSPNDQVGMVLNKYIKDLRYFDCFSNYYKGKTLTFDSNDKIMRINAFVFHATSCKMTVSEYLRYLESLQVSDETYTPDNEKKYVLLSTIHKIKGLEFQYVLIPECHDGHIPCLNCGGSDLCYNKKIHDIPDKTGEEERRLFYVAITRTRDTLYLYSYKNHPATYINELKLPETDLFVNSLNNQKFDDEIMKINQENSDEYRKLMANPVITDSK